MTLLSVLIFVLIILGVCLTILCLNFLFLSEEIKKRKEVTDNNIVNLMVIGRLGGIVSVVYLALAVITLFVGTYS